ncbi:MAG: hypothetical protein ACO3JL_15910, partial [Myxococcota bacterium]
GLALAQRKADAENNETAASVDLIRLLELADTFVTMDAAGGSPNLTEAILDRCGDSLLMVKDDQPTPKTDIEALAWEASTASTPS